MTITDMIDGITDWLNEEVCPHISLKVPDDERNTTEYSFQEAHPRAYPMYIPGKDKLPDADMHTCPAVCVELMSGKEDLKEHSRGLEIRLALLVWNPGVHGAEVYRPDNPEASPEDISYQRTDDGSYQRNMSGYRDILNFTDLVVNRLIAAEYIGGTHIDKRQGIDYGPFYDGDAIWDGYPYWAFWVRFHVEASSTQAIPQSYIEQLL